MTTDRNPQWDAVIRICHWFTLALIIAAWWAVETHGEYPKGSTERTLWMNRHVTFGLAIWFLTVFRLGWRMVHPAPEVAMPEWQRRFAHLVQAGLYLVLLAMPVFGIAARQFAQREINFAGQFSLPQWVTEQNPAWAEWFAEIHEEVFWPTLLVLAGVHAAGALWHQFAKKDNLIGRMFWSRH
ncbi:MAG: cytochrome b [Pseudomonadota bacterium]|nr:cytochrome b [Pseudomonadota bacterium]